MKSTSSLVIPMAPNTSAITGRSISTSLCSSSRRTFCDWANEATDTGRTARAVRAGASGGGGHRYSLNVS